MQPLPDCGLSLATSVTNAAAHTKATSTGCIHSVVYSAALATHGTARPWQAAPPRNVVAATLLPKTVAVAHAARRPGGAARRSGDPAARARGDGQLTSRRRRRRRRRAAAAATRQSQNRGCCHDSCASCIASATVGCVS